VVISAGGFWVCAVVLLADSGLYRAILICYLQGNAWASLWVLEAVLLAFLLGLSLAGYCSLRLAIICLAYANNIRTVTQSNVWLL